MTINTLASLTLLISIYVSFLSFALKEACFIKSKRIIVKQITQELHINDKLDKRKFKKFKIPHRLCRSQSKLKVTAKEVIFGQFNQQRNFTRLIK
jgi:hypothetical protein